MGGVVSGILIISAVIAVGYLAVRCKLLAPEVQGALTRTAFYITNPALLFTVAAVFVLRRKLPDMPRPFRTPGYPVVPILFMAGTILGLGCIVWGQISKNDWSGVWGLLISLAGYPVYWIWKRIANRESRIA